MLQQSLNTEQNLTAEQRVLRLEGPLVMSTLSRFDEAVSGDGAGSLIIDLTGVPYLDTAGIGVLVAAYVNSQDSGRNLALVGANKRVRNSLRIAWVESLFRFFDSVRAAENSAQ